jgi:hypothetical protein
MVSARHWFNLEVNDMMDVAFVLTTVVFFALSWAFVKGCERL